MSAAFARALGTAFVLASLATASAAAAFCRTTTCDPRDASQACEADPTTQCVLSGIPLHWPTECVSFGVQKNASPLRGITYDAAHTTITSAFQSWLGADCGGGTPGISIGDSGMINCDRPEYNQDAPNANVWMFRDDTWPYAGGEDSTIALTTVTYNTENGEIYDADVEINSYFNQITIGDANVQYDLLSIATHEAGHFLGLSHSNVPGATMLFSYQSGDTSLRSLSADDIAGICTAYPPGRPAVAGDCTPRHGFSVDCAPAKTSCNVSGVGRPEKNGFGFVLGLTALCALGRARRLRALRRRG